MKKKDFELIVPAYDALEAELEEILGGGGDDECTVFICGKHEGGGGGTSDGCFALGSVTPLDEFTWCCPGATPWIYEDSNLGKVVVCMEA